jgi:hypothetical protein
VFEVVSLAQLKSHLWEAARILRGSPVDRTDWKSYNLPLWGLSAHGARKNILFED